MTFADFAVWRREEDARVRERMRESMRAEFRRLGIDENSPACKAALNEAERYLAEHIARQEAEIACAKAAR